MKTIMIILWLELFLMASVEAHAGNVVGLTPFTANTAAKASEVNGNFNAVKTAVDDNYSRLSAAGAVSLSQFAFSDGLGTGSCSLQRTGNYAHFLETNGGCNAVAPISLPHGKTVTSISCSVYDDEGATTPNIVGVAFSRNSLSIDWADTILANLTATTAAGLQTLTADTVYADALIDNYKYTYYVSLHFDLTGATSPYSLRLYGCTVAYKT